ncbi:Indoleamine 2,3-dioxygenase [Elsinoe ampelina]|uniref:Indoleamine 2,3-dioxygenase n=1 Tax=Elsinoe ampelina TaxID=302913 RepID=A0A6A6GJK3_9PEZI|nr:Indoleamine 2,3-dioxygenase [Elsinoe ampelina]
MSPHKISTVASLLDVSAYGISQNGFLPGDAPLRSLPNPYYQPWEALIGSLPEHLEGKTLRTAIDNLAVLSTDGLDTEPEWQRAYLILTMLAQGYIWQGPQPSERLPPAISIPLLAVSSHLSVLPVATYAALNLWNWTPTSVHGDICNPDNLVALHTFTGTDDESWFYVVSNAMEARAAPVLAAMLLAMQAVEQNNADGVIESLDFLAKSLVEIGELIDRMHERCDPMVFYHQIRPYLAGSKNMQAAGLPDGVFFDEGAGKGKWRRYRGGSNGQSSFIQFFDAVLGVVHEKTQDFHQEMRRYMPGPHARFLNEVCEVANIREYVESRPRDGELTLAFNDAVASLTVFRNKHLNLVSRYIIVPSRQPKPVGKSVRQDLATACSTIVSGQELVGTGGTKLLPFLKQTRDDTASTSV